MVRGDRRSAMIQGSGVPRWRAEPDAGRSRWRAGLAVAGAAALLGARAARAETAYDFLPSASVGVTNNAAASPNPPIGDPRFGVFSILTATGRAHKLTTHSDNSLGLRLSDTFYLHGPGPTALMAELAAVSDLTLSDAWQLRLSGGVTYGQTSSPTPIDVNKGIPSVLPSAANPYASASAAEEGLYSLSPRTRFVEALRFAGVHYLNRKTPPPDALGLPPVNNSFVVGATLRAERDFVDNLFILEGDGADSVAPGRDEQALGLANQVFLWQALAGWRRDFGLAWSGELKGGVLGIFDNQGTDIIRPAGSATVGYRQTYWFATLTAGQAAAPNVFIAAATISDSALARLALPIGHSERFYALGYGGYTYARLVDSTGTYRGYDLWTLGASLTARSEKYPLWGSIDYTFSSQIGNRTSGGSIPNLERQALLFTIGGAFTTGREQPPIFHGVMGAIRPMTDQTSGNAAGFPGSFGSGGAVETPGAPGWSGSPQSALPAGSKVVTPVPTTPGAPGWSGTPTTTDTPGAPGWSGSSNATPQGSGSGNVDNVAR